jgi:dienelactone hydrolase
MSDYFETYDKKADKLFIAGRYTEAIALLEQSIGVFPEYTYESISYILTCYRELKQFDKCLETIERSVKQGYFFGLDWEGWDPIRTLDGAEPILAENDRLRDEAQKRTKMEYEVLLPNDYTPEKRYPLILTMHGHGGSIGNKKIHRHFWPPDAMLKRGFIVVYLQSSRILSSTGYGWIGDDRQLRTDIRQCYDEVIAQHPVDTEKTIVSGFSGGGMAAIDVALNAIVPAIGFIALCPVKPEDFSKECCEDAARRGIRGVLMEGELSGDVPALQEMEAAFKEAGLPCESIINEGIAHWYPADLSEKLDRAIAFILNE